jgi:hypothetical protein
LFGQTTDFSGLDDERLARKGSLSEQLPESSLDSVDDWDSTILGVGALFSDLFRDQRPELVEVDDWSVEGVLVEVEVSHTDLTEVTRMVLVHVDAVMMLTTSKTATTRMLSVLT